MVCPFIALVVVLKLCKNDFSRQFYPKNYDFAIFVPKNLHMTGMSLQFVSKVNDFQFYYFLFKPEKKKKKSFFR